MTCTMIDTAKLYELMEKKLRDVCGMDDKGVDIMIRLLCHSVCCSSHGHIEVEPERKPGKHERKVARWQLNVMEENRRRSIIFDGHEMACESD